MANRSSESSTGRARRGPLSLGLKPATKEALGAYLFAAPTLLGYLLFVVGPVVAVVVISFLDWNILTPPKWAGLANYARLLSDRRLGLIYRNTVQLAVLLVAGDIVVGLAMALVVNQALGRLVRYITRTAFFFPVLMSSAVVSVIWWYFFHYDLGVINYYLVQLGGPRIPWLISRTWAVPSIVILSLWKGVGFSFIIMLAGLQSVPAHLYEAASIDGAGPLARFRHVTIPMITPTIFFLLVIDTIGAVQTFDAPTILTQGGPADASRTIVMHIYANGFRFLQMGYASTLALTLFALVMVLTLIQFRLSRSWVFYQ